jgi:hypothetical protein
MAKRRTTDKDRFAGLNNAEIVFMYYRLKNYKTVLDKNLEKNAITTQVSTDLGIVTTIKQVKPEHIEKFKQTEYYKIANEILEKLSPVVSIIEQCDDSVMQLLKELK